MPSRHSSLAPAFLRSRAEEARASTAPKPLRKRSLSLLIRATGSRITLKPKRDALTRVRHDLRSLVHSVVGYSDLLAEPRYGALSPEQARFVSHVRGAAEHLQELVDTCIELSRPQAPDRGHLELPETPLGQLLRRVRNAFAERQLACDLSIASELETRAVTLDVSGLERALVGLALVITRDGSVSCELSVSRLDSALLITVRASDAADSAQPSATLDQLEDQVGNRDFVRLKLSEVLLSRQAGSLHISPALDTALLTLTL
jgi:hypothetical protein